MRNQNIQRRFVRGWRRTRRVMRGSSCGAGGIKVVLMQDRPVLGGNASSEIRMWICGATAGGEHVRESGLPEEIIMENYYRNTNLSFSIWDSVLYPDSQRPSRISRCF